MFCQRTDRQTDERAPIGSYSQAGSSATSLRNGLTGPPGLFLPSAGKREPRACRSDREGKASLGQRGKARGDVQGKGGGAARGVSFTYAGGEQRVF